MTYLPTLRKSGDRGLADHGWLRSRHTFSFADYYDPAHMGFRSLRVINQDVVAPGRGFGTHPHRDMEIFSYVLEGTLSHRDSLGNGRQLRPGQIQLMSAGSGITHSEFNHSSTEAVDFLQIWIFPKVRNIAPRYEQATFAEKDRINQWQRLVSPIADSSFSLKMNQDAYISRTALQEGQALPYEVNKAGNGLYLFIIAGEVTVGGVQLPARDGLAIENVHAIELKALNASDILLIEIPLKTTLS